MATRQAMLDANTHTYTNTLSRTPTHTHNTHTTHTHTHSYAHTHSRTHTCQHMCAATYCITRTLPATPTAKRGGTPGLKLRQDMHAHPLPPLAAGVATCLGMGGWGGRVGAGGGAREVNGRKVGGAGGGR